MEQFSFRENFVRWDNRQLILGNGFFTREIRLSAGFPATESITAGKTRWAVRGDARCDLSFLGLNAAGDGACDFSGGCTVRAELHENPEFDAPHIAVTLEFTEAVQQIRYTRIFRLYLDAPALSVQNFICSGVLPGCYWSHRAALSGQANTSRFAPHRLESAVDSFCPADGVTAQGSVEFAGRTDYHNEPVRKHRLRNGDFAVNGNLLLLKHRDGAKMVLLQEAPPSGERRDFEKHDFRFAQGRIFSCCWGIAPEDLEPGKTMQSYRNTFLFGTPQEHFGEMVQTYVMRRFPMREKEAAILVNPWGCGHFPEWVSPEFLRREILAAGKIGAEVYQIDDGWQQGAGLNELTGNNRCIPPDFWEVSPEKLPQGFAPLCAAAKAAKIQLGLWCAPHFNVAYRDWEIFAARILDYHRRFGFFTFKLDGTRLQSYESEENFRNLLSRVRTRSRKRVYFNLDTTNGQRPGYFLFLEYGSIFLENRYVSIRREKLGASFGYQPVKTLRNLWHLAEFVPPRSLQIEVPSPDDVPGKCTPGEAPLDYSFEFWCAVALFAGMLIWSTPSRMSESTVATLTRMTALQKKVRRLLWGKTVVPVGREPADDALSGFSGGGLLLLFCGKNCTDGRYRLPRGKWRILSGAGEMDGKTVQLQPGHYVLLQQFSGGRR